MTVAEHGKVQIFKAVGLHAAGKEVSLARELIQIPGVQKGDVHVVAAKTSGKNAADAVLSVLYGVHAGSLNYVLSDDKQWFGELPHMIPDKRTVWLKFSELDGLCKSNNSMPKLFLEYMKEERKQTFSLMQSWSDANTKSVLKEMYNGRRFREYVESVKQLEWNNGLSEQEAINAVAADRH